MAGKAIKRSQQMVAIAQARTGRAAEAVQLAQKALATEEAALQIAEAERDAADKEQQEAQKLLAQSPGSDQHRMWLSHCRNALAGRIEAVAEQQERIEEARFALEEAMAHWQRQQLREEHLTQYAASEKKQAARTAERRLEDEMQGQGSASTPSAMAL
jgi:hypothetical protein